ncbi:hypothetical protein DFH28DRAFT_905732 [Melampsora americana]|nr:hypothetical protein DFH28DRAFT_905732 [Melampsora americana]
MSLSICDDVLHWGVRAARAHAEACWICYDYVSPVLFSQAQLRRQKKERRENEKRHYKEMLKAERVIKLRNQSARQSAFRTLREALYLVSTYTGPYLQRPGDKKKAALFIRKNDLAGIWVSKFAAGDAKWKWLDQRIASCTYTM